MSATANGSSRSELFAFADAFIERNAALNPMAATDYGIDRYDDLLTDFSLASTQERTDLLRSSLAALVGIVPTDDVDRIGKEVMVERMSSGLGLEESGERRRTFSVLSSPASPDPPGVRHPAGVSVPSTPRGSGRASRPCGPRSRAGAAPSTRTPGAGLAAARRQALGVAGQLDVYAGGAFSAVARRATVSCGVDDPSALVTAATDADQACGELAVWLRTVYVPRATAGDAVGPERYGPWATYFNGAELDLVEIHQWGWADLQRINARMWEIAAEVAPGATTLTEVAARLDADEDRAVHGAEALLERLRGLTEGAVAMLDGVHFDIDERVRFCDARLAPEGSAAAPYYIAPSEDLSRPGTTWFPTLGHDRFPLWRLVSTWYHESVPGHHLQCATTILERQRQTRFQRLEGFISGYGEGWALYAERLMDELGAFDDPGDEMGFLSCPGSACGPDRGRHRHAPGPPGSARHRSARRPRRRGRAYLGRRHGRGPARGEGHRAHRHGPLRGGPLPGSARSGHLLQGGRAGLARGPRRRPAPSGPGVRSEGLARPRPGARAHGPRPLPKGDGGLSPTVTTSTTSTGRRRNAHVRRRPGRGLT